MNCFEINAFFSHSHAEIDNTVNVFFRNICEGLGVKLHSVNVKNKCDAMTEANKLIEKCDLFFAVVTARNELNGRFDMSQAVREEIICAIAHNRPMAIFTEGNVGGNGMIDEGIKKVIFDRNNIHSKLPEFIKIINSLKMNIILTKKILTEISGADKYYFESTKSVVNLKHFPENLDKNYWEYKCKRVIRFVDDFNSVISFKAWSHISAQPIEGYKTSSKASVIDTSKEFDYVIEYKNSSHVAEVSISFGERHPAFGDFVEIDLIWSSKYFNPMFSEEVDIDKTSSTNYKTDKYYCVDGVALPYKTSFAEIMFIFPVDYYEKIAKCLPTARIADNRTEGVLTTELEKIVLNIERFCDEIVLHEIVQNLSPNVIYGLMWNPPSRELFYRSI